MAEATKSREPVKNREEFGQQVYAEAQKEIRESLPKIAINVFIAIIIWLVANFVFMPISTGLFVQTFAVTQLISFIVLIAFAVLVIGIVRELRDVADASAGIVAYHAGQAAQVDPQELQNYRTAFRGLLYVLVVAAAFLLFAAQLNLLHPAIAAIVLLIIVVWAILTLFRVGRAFSRSIQHYAQEWAKRLTKPTGEGSR